MKKIALILFIGFNLVLSAQDEVTYEFDIKTAENTKQRPPDPVNIYEDYIVTIGDYIYVSYFNGIDLSYDIEKFNKQTKEKVDFKKISLELLPKMYMIEGLFTLKNGKSYLKYSYWDKPNKIEQLFLLEIDMEKGVIIGEKKLILESTKITNLPFFSSGYGMMDLAFKFPHFLSGDSNELIIYFKKEPKSNKNSKNIDEIELVKLDEEFNILSRVSYFMPKVEYFIRIKDYIWFQDNLLILIEDKDRVAENNFALLKLDSETKSVIRIDIDLIGKEFHHNYIRVTNKYKISKVFSGYENEKINSYFTIKDDILYLYGYCYDKESKDDALYVVKLDKKFDINIRLHYFDSDFISNYLKIAKKQRYIVNHSIEIDKNSIVIVGEVFGFSQESSSTTFRGLLGLKSFSPVSSYSMCPQDIIINKFDLDLKPIWQAKLPKNQFGELNTSFAQTNKNGDYYFFYINHLDNLERSLEQKPKQYTMDRDGNLEVAKIDVNGKITRKALLRLQTEGIKVFPAKFSFDTENNLIIDAKKEGEDAFIKILID